MDELQTIAGIGSSVVTKQMGDMTSYVAHEDGKIITGSIQDATPYVEHAAQLRATGATGNKEMWHMASFPAIAVETYCNTNGIDFREFMANREHVRRMVADPALAAFRVHAGSL